MKTLIAMTSAALLSLSFGAAAQAQSDIPSTKVSYADLDLSRASGRQVLERRVERAVARVCPSRPLPSELRRQKTYRECRAAAWTGAQRQLAALYSGNRLAESAVHISGAGVN